MYINTGVFFSWKVGNLYSAMRSGKWYNRKEGERESHNSVLMAIMLTVSAFYNPNADNWMKSAQIICDNRLVGF